MQTLSEKSMSVLCKSCRIFHNKSKKLGLYFSVFSTIFYEFYKIQHLHIDLVETDLRTGPRISQTGPRAIGSLAPCRRRELNSGEGKARLGRERVGECSGTHLRPVCGRSWGRGGSGGGVRRWRVAATAGASAPARS
jgi:hypothetical protein